MLKEDLTVNIHDIYPAELLRLVHPEQLVESLKQHGLPVKDVAFSSEEGRIEIGVFTVNNHKITYQVCGLSALDEYIIFRKNTPQELVDKVLAVLELTMAKEMIKIHQRKIGFALTPNEFLAITDKKLEVYRNEKIAEANQAIEEAKQVLKGEKSYFDTKLKNYKRPPTLAEALIEMGMKMIALDNFVEDKMKNENETIRYLVKSYIEWKTKITGFENLYKTFQEKIKSRFEALSTKPQKGWGELNEKDKKELKILETAINNPKLIETAIQKGELILPQFQQKTEKRE